MKYFFSVFFFIIITFLSLQTEAQIKSIEKLIETGKYRQAYNELQKKYIKSPQNVDVLYMLSSYYLLSDNLLANNELAYYYMDKVWDGFVEAVQKKEGRKILKWKKEGITVQNIRGLQDEIAKTALSDAKKVNTIEAYDKIIHYYKKEPSVVAEAARLRITVAFKNAKEINNIHSYKAFIDIYPYTKEAKEAKELYNNLLYRQTLEKNSSQEIKEILNSNYDFSLKKNIESRLNELAFQKASEEGSAKAYRHFLSNYPTSIQYDSVLELREEAEFLEKAIQGTAKAYLDFAEHHPESRYYEIAVDSMLSIAWKYKNIDILNYYLKNYPLDNSWNEIYLKLYNWYTSDGELFLIEDFEKKYPDFPYKLTIKNDKILSKKLDSIDLKKVFTEKSYNKYSEMIRVFMGKDIAFILLQRVLENFISSNNKMPALHRLNDFEICFENSKEYQELKNLLSKPSENNIIHKKNIFPSYGNKINPVLSVNGRTLYFSVLKDGKHEIYTSTKNNSGFSFPEQLIGIQSGDYPSWVSESENEMLFIRNGDIYMATKEDGFWFKKEKLPYPINTAFYESDAVFIPDGSGILFVSDRDGGKNIQPSGIYFHGDTLPATDIYYSKKTADGWSMPINLGLKINTRYCEHSPFLSSDMRTLYFASDGYGGFGHLEIMYAQRISDTSWTDWNTPQNMGWHVNSSGSDLYPNFSLNGEFFYYSSSNTKGLSSIYEITFKKAPFENRTHSITINVLDEKDSVIEADIRLVDLNKSNIISEKKYKPTGKNIQFKYLLGNNYGIFAYKKGYFSTSVNIGKYPVKNAVITIFPINDLIKRDTLISLGNIYFDNSQVTLEDYSIYELKSLAEQIKKISCNVEIYVSYANTDDKKQCFDISARRANSVKTFLIGEGISSDRIITIGLGNKDKKPGNNVQIKFKN